MVPDLNPITFGARLREARERRGISLRQIANATKIAVAVLDALERNDISRLPGGIFGRAFVRSYAVEVGLDPERTIQEFITQFPHDSVVAGHPTSQVDVHFAVQNDDRRMSAVFLVLLAGVVVAGWAVYFGAWRTLASHAAAFLTVQSTPAVRAPQPPPIVPDPAAAHDRSAAESAAPTGDAAAASPEAIPLPAAPRPSGGGAEDRLTVRLSVSRPCWVSAMVDGRKAIERLLETGEDQTLNVRREIVLTAADAGAVALTLNGESAKPLGQAGEVVTARLSLANFRDFLTTR
jgi:cytoskeleton protein RodZ